MTQLFTPISDKNPGYCFRIPPDKQGGGRPEGIPEEKTLENVSDYEEYILCRQCHQVLTAPSERIAIEGSHRHTFANPHGIIFQIGCFRSVHGCGYVGPATAEWSWFKGFRWRVVVCGMCLTHLGWFYTSSANQNFTGLILDRLLESKSVNE